MRKLPERLIWVRRFERAVARRADTIADIAYEEIGKPAHETLTADVLSLLNACRWHRSAARGLLRPRRLSGGGLLHAGQRHVEHHAPLGRVAVIATWNYPVLLLGIQLMQAIVGGNRVIVKPSERTPRTQGLLLDCAEQAGLPSGWLERRPAERDAGRELVEHGEFDHLIFTGSTLVGREIARALADRLIPSTLELSGCDSVIVLEKADPKIAAGAIWRGVTMNGGRTCMAPRRIIVTRAIRDRFMAALRDAAQTWGAACPIEPEQEELVRRLASEAIEAGGRAGDSVFQQAGVTLVEDCPPEPSLAIGEHFAPAVAVLEADSNEQAFALHERFGQHLTVSVFGRELPAPADLAHRLGASNITLNDVILPVAHPGSAIIGRGPSGWGASQGSAGLLAMTRPVVVSHTSRLVRIPAAPPGERLLRRIRALIRWRYARGLEHHDRQYETSRPHTAEAQPPGIPPRSQVNA